MTAVVHSGDPPTLSVAFFTYNHAKFIRQSLDGVLNQQIDFNFEIVIGEDCSTDGTREVVTEYAKRYPSIIRLLDRPTNIGAMENFIATIDACRGVYIAMLDGDDYWCRSDKLQRQVDQLRNDSKLALSFHAVMRQRSDGISEIVYPRGRRDVYTFADVAKYGCVHTSAAILRRTAFPSFPSWFRKAPCGDWPTFLTALSQGDGGYIDGVMSVYRHHEDGAAQSWREDRRVALDVATRLRKLMIPEFGVARALDLQHALYRGYYQMVHAQMQNGAESEARELLRGCQDECGWNINVDPLEPYKSLLHTRLPRLYRSLQYIRTRLRSMVRSLRSNLWLHT